ncbi:MAG: DUF3783 domain-containing protein [bacterium]|nr:DUF3783 domain-containing protein [bacterium]
MKARETVLLYHITDKEKEKRLKRVLLLMGVRVRMVEPEQYGLSIESLLRGNAADVNNAVNMADAANMTDSANAANTADSADAANTADSADAVMDIEEEMLVLHGFSGKRLDEFLAALRKNQARVDLKAVATETNKKWNSWQLYAELKREHEVMHKKQE